VQRLLVLHITAAALVAMPVVARAQSLNGSLASINRMYAQARAENFSFFQTGSSVRQAVDAGRLVPLRERAAPLDVVGVTYPYVRPATRTFVERLAEQYRDSCGEPLVVTSAVRPTTRQPANASDRSVHPTGMAIDLRKPRKASCLRWLRGALLDLERRGLLEATEERRPAHFHVAVYSTPYTRYVASRGTSNAVAFP
jgi:hypothetical protein